MFIHGNILDFFGVFLAGVMVSLTPCVYPLIPVTAALIAGANVNGTRRTGIFFSLIYVFGLALSYAALAVFAALTGKVFGVMQNTPVVLIVLGSVFALFAFVMFDLIPMPGIRLFSSFRPRTPWAVFMMGLASGFAVGPCTAPVLGGLLAYVATKQNMVYGASLLFVFACGVGTLLVIAGACAGVMASLPRSGVWMVWIKRTAGFIFLIFSGYYFLRALNII